MAKREVKCQGMSEYYPHDCDLCNRYMDDCDGSEESEVKAEAIGESRVGEIHVVSILKK